MTEEEHYMLAAVYGKICKMPDRRDLGKAKREIISSVLTNRHPESELYGPSNKVRQEQVEKVKKILLDAYYSNRVITLSQACLEAWEPINGGYPTPKSLYVYCHSHEYLFDWSNL